MQLNAFLNGTGIWYLQGAFCLLGIIILGVMEINYTRLERALKRVKTEKTTNNYLMGITRAYLTDISAKNVNKVDNFVDNYMFIHRVGVTSLKNGENACGQVINCMNLSTLALLGVSFYIGAEWNLIGRVFFAGLICNGGLFFLERLLDFKKRSQKIRSSLIILLEWEKWKNDKVGTMSESFEKKRMKAINGVKSQADKLIKMSTEPDTDKTNTEQEDMAETMAERVARDILEGKVAEERIARDILEGKAMEERIAAGAEPALPEDYESLPQDPVEQAAKVTVGLAVEKATRELMQANTGETVEDESTFESHTTEAIDRLSGRDRQLINDFLCNLTTR